MRESLLKHPTSLRQPAEKEATKAMGHELTTEGDDVAAVFMDKLPRDGLLHDLLHLEGKAAGEETPPPHPTTQPGDILIATCPPTLLAASSGGPGPVACDSSALPSP